MKLSRHDLVPDVVHDAMHVRIPGCISQSHPVLSGVPQDTVLGPSLFLIMIIDIDKSTPLVLS